MTTGKGDPIRSLLESSCVKIRDKDRGGTGCFVSPQLLITCAHVIPPHKRPGDRIEIVPDHTPSPFEAEILTIERHQDEDFCILRSLTYQSSHFLVLDNDVLPGDLLVGYGYPVYDGEVRADGFLAEYEAITRMSDPVRFPHGFHKVKNTHIQHGTSGSPMVNLRTGLCIGIITESRDSASERGGWLIPASLLIEKLTGISDFGKGDWTERAFWLRAVAAFRDGKKADADSSTSQSYSGVFIPFSDRAIQYKVNGHWAFEDDNGQLRDPCRFYRRGDIAPVFCSGFFKIASSNGKFGFIDTNGHMQISCSYEECDCVSENFVAVKKDGLWGLVSATNTITIPFEFKDMSSPRGGLIKAKKDSGYGLMDIQGRELIPQGFKALRIVSKDAIIATDFNNRRGLIDHKGLIRLPFEFQYIRPLEDSFFSFVKTSGQAGLYDSATNQCFMTEDPLKKILPSFLNASAETTEITHLFRLSADRLVAKTNNSAFGWTLFFLLQYSEGKLVECFNLKQTGISAEDILSLSEGKIMAVREDRRGFYTGATEKIPCIYEDALPFNHGLAAVKKEGAWGWIDSDNHLRIPFKYEDVRSFANGLAGVKLNGKWGFIDTQGKQIVNHYFQQVGSFADRRCFVRYTPASDNYWTLLDDKGRMLSTVE